MDGTLGCGESVGRAHSSIRGSRMATSLRPHGLGCLWEVSHLSGIEMIAATVITAVLQRARCVCWAPHHYGGLSLIFTSVMPRPLQKCPAESWAVVLVHSQSISACVEPWLGPELPVPGLLCKTEPHDADLSGVPGGTEEGSESLLDLHPG